MTQTNYQSLIKELIDGFGHLNKKDYEVAIFHYMLDNELKGKTDFDISRKLKITEAKVKQLRYESNLVYGQDYDDEYFKNRFYEVLHQSTFKPVGENKMQFAINDKMLRLYLLDKLAKYGSFADSSFNSNIVTVTASDMVILLADFDGQKEILEQIKKQLEAGGKIEPQKMSPAMKERIKALIYGASKFILQIGIDWLLYWITNN